MRPQTAVRIMRLLVAAALSAAWLYWLGQWYEHPRFADVTIHAVLGFGLLGLAAWVLPIGLGRWRIVARIVGTLLGLIGGGLSALLNELVMQGI